MCTQYKIMWALQQLGKQLCMYMSIFSCSVGLRGGAVCVALLSIAYMRRGSGSAQILFKGVHLIQPQPANFLLDLMEVLKERDKTEDRKKRCPLLRVSLSEWPTLELCLHWNICSIFWFLKQKNPAPVPVLSFSLSLISLSVPLAQARARVSSPSEACLWPTAATLCRSYLSLADLGAGESLCLAKPRVICMSWEWGGEGSGEEKKRGETNTHEAKWGRAVESKWRRGKRCGKHLVRYERRGTFFCLAWFVHWLY